MKIQNIKLGMVIVILCCLSIASHAGTFNINISGISKHDGTAIDPTKATVTAYIGNAANPDKSGSCTSTKLLFSDASGVNITNNLKIVVDAINFSGLSNQVNAGNWIYLRIWEDGTDLFSLTSYYVDLLYQVKGTPTEDFTLVFDKANYYCNYYPPTPSIAINIINPEKLSRNGITLPPSYDLQLNYVITPGIAYKSQVSKYQVQIVKKDVKAAPNPADWPIAKDNIAWFDNSNSSTPTNDFYVGGKWYYLRARAKNQLGPDDTGDDIGTGWSNQAEYQSATGGGGPQPDFLLSLKIGVNSFSMPFPSPWKIGAQSITTALDLVKGINTMANKNTVSSFGIYDNANKMVKGVMIIYKDATVNNIDKYVGFGGAAKLDDITINQGEGYQAYLKDDVANLKISNK